MTYRIEVAPAALRQLRKLDRAAQRRVQAAIELLAMSPRPSGAKKLMGGGGEWRVRTGDYRIVYQIEDGVLLSSWSALATAGRFTTADRPGGLGSVTADLHMFRAASGARTRRTDVPG